MTFSGGLLSVTRAAGGCNSTVMRANAVCVLFGIECRRVKPASDLVIVMGTGLRRLRENCAVPNGTQRSFPFYPALRQPTPLRANAARIGGPGCGSVLG
jgi:hypothetical protein